MTIKDDIIDDIKFVISPDTTFPPGLVFNLEEDGKYYLSSTITDDNYRWPTGYYQ